MSSLLKMPLITFFISLLFVNFSIAGYVLEDDYSPSNFFSMFSFFTETDPTNGFVEYVDQSTAQSNGYINASSSKVYIGADHDNVTPNGRPSVRLTSNKAYNAGTLVILDLEHMPGGVCGTWPAFWMVGPDWPSGGEIDIIEGVNEQSTNAMTLHTGSGCAITNDGNFTGSVSTLNCDINASGQSANAGCSIDSSDDQTFGSGFNGGGGGVYATEWTDESISVWFFPRGSIPSDVSSGNPNPGSSWGTPTAQFQGGCNIPDFFQNNNIVFDLTFCGDWAGDAWSSSSCSSKADTCNNYVENNPSAFQDAYWSINSLQVFQYSSSSSYSASSSAQASSTQAASSVVPVSSASSTSSSSSSWVASTTSSSAPSTAASAPSHSWSMSFPWKQRATSTSATALSGTSGVASSTIGTNPASQVTGVSGAGSESSALGAASASDAAADSTFWIQTAPLWSSTSTVVGAASSSSEPVPTTFWIQTAPLWSSTSSAGATAAAATNAPSAASSESTAVPTSQAEINARVAAIAEDWSTSQPSNWQDEVNALESAMDVVASQSAAVSAKLQQNQRRHLAQHRRRLSGYH